MGLAQVILDAAQATADRLSVILVFTASTNGMFNGLRNGLDNGLHGMACMAGWLVRELSSRHAPNHSISLF